MDDAPERTTLHVVPISAHADDRWRLSGRYVEDVWSEYLGPTATLLARRFSRMMEERPGGVDIDLGDLGDLGDLAASVGVQRGIAVKALERLNRFEVVYFSADQSIVGMSGFVRSVQGGRVSRLSERGRVMHDRLVADQPARRPDHRTPSGRDRGSPAPTEAEHAAKRRLRWADDGDNEQDMIPRAQRRLVWRRHRLVEQVRSCVVRSIGISTLCRLGVCRIGSARALIGAHRWFEHSVRFGAG
jgi:hypothetical protein